MKKSALLVLILLSFLIFLASHSPRFGEAGRSGHFSFFISQASAQTKTEQTHSAGSGQANYPAANTNPDVPNNLHNWTQNVMIEVMLSLTCQLVGIDPTQPNGQCLGIDQKTGKIGFLPAGNLAKGEIGGAIGGIGNMISVLYTPPLHTADYVRNLASNFGIVKNANAQNLTTGFESLSPLIDVWIAFRNIVYLVFVIVFVVIGLAIMFRVKIDPRTVMTIQNQIPKIIIGILLVTFSYAIAGFLIDMMWVFIYIIYGVLAPVAEIEEFNPTNLQGSSPFGLIGFGNFLTIPVDAAAGIGDFIASLLGGTSGAGRTASALTAATIGALLGFILGPIGSLVGGAIGGTLGTITGGNAIGFVGGIIAFTIITIALLMALFRLWFTLIMAYVQILFSVVLAPFWIIGGIVPGSPISFGGWIRNLGANLLAFPVVIGMFLLGKVFMDAFGSPETKDGFVPPLIGNPGDTNAIGALIGLGIILMAPNVVNMLKAAIKAPKVETGAAMQPIGSGFGVIKGTAGSVFSYGSKLPKIDEPQRWTGVLSRIFR